MSDKRYVNAVTFGDLATDRLFDEKKEETVQIILESPMACMHAMKNWPSKRVALYESQFIDLICSEGTVCYAAGQHWPPPLFLPHAARIGRSLQKDHKNCYVAGTKWRDENFIGAAEFIAMGLTPDDVLDIDDWVLVTTKNDRSLRTKRRWRSQAINSIRPIGPEFFTRLDFHTKKAWLTYIKYIPRMGIATLSATDAKLVVEAQSFADGSTIRPFYQGLTGSLKQGSVREWAKYIIDYHRNGTKGGAKYRTLEVCHG